MKESFDQPENGFQAIRFDGQMLELLDQRRLPVAEEWLPINSVDEAIEAIVDLVVRGAPAIGITAAYASILAARDRNGNKRLWLEDMARLESARPTAVNLGWAVERMRASVASSDTVDEAVLLDAARAIHADDIRANRAMAEAGSAHLGQCSGVLTHCNTGSIATGGIGTALGVIMAGVRSGQIDRVFADETRPWLQGSRLTAWELARENMDCQVIVEGAAAALMASGRIQWVITGADRIAANGDVANKIGTYSLAVLARHHQVRFMVVAPSSTLDPSMPNGQSIEIEQRDPGEIWRAAGLNQAPDGFSAWNPVFDVTPGDLIDCIVTEQGVFEPPYHF